jgi:capsular polysaccharide transport system permease protein
MVSAHFDLISGNVSVSVKAFTPEQSLKLAQALITASNDIFRRLNIQAQKDFVRISEENVRSAEQQLAKVRQELLAFREKSGLLDLDRTSQAGSAIIDELRKQLAGFQAQYASVKASSPNSPALTGLSAQIAALEGQIKNAERTNTSTTVNAVTAETLGQYQKLDLDRQFAEKQYTEALGLRNQAYITAQNQQSYLALFVQPTLAQTSVYPDRVMSIVTVFLVAGAVWFIGMLVTYAVRDHLV